MKKGYVIYHRNQGDKLLIKVNHNNHNYYLRLLIAVTNVEHYPPRADFFRNYLNAKQLLDRTIVNHDQWEYLWKVARATSAAPTFFNQCEQYIDGN